MDLRELKGLEIAARCRIEFKDGAWRVPSQSTTGFYRVVLSPDGEACECEDHSLTQQPCKHIFAVRFVRERDRGAKSPTIVDSEPKRKSYPQNWPLYNKAQQTEKHRFQELLFDLCRGLPEPPRKPGPGRKPHAIGDRIFSMAYKVYSTFSARRFHCDLADAHERGYTRKLIPGTKVFRFFEDPDLAPVLQSLIVRSSLPLRAVETVFAPDSTGFSVSRFVRWYDEKFGVTKSGKDWVKAHAICGVKTNIVTAVEIGGRDANDCPFLPSLVSQTAANFKVGEVVADKQYLSKENLAVVEALGAAPFIPFKSNNKANGDSIWDRLFHYYQYRREEFLKHYHARSNAESTFGMLKAKFRDHVRSKSDVAMRNEVFCKFLCHNICVCIQSQLELGVSAEFWPDEPEGERAVVLPLVRPG